MIQNKKNQKKPRLIFFLRLYDGFESSFFQKKWRPKGVPTIVHLIEKIDKSDWNVKFVFTKFNENESKTFSNSEYDKKITGLNNKINIIRNQFDNKRLRRIKNIFYFLKRIIIYLNLSLRFKPDLIYIDRSHAFEGAIFSRFWKFNVFLRIMGVGVYDITSLKKQRFRFSLFKWIFKSPFKYVLFSQDGSDNIKWSKKFLNNKVESIGLINGVNKQSEPKKNLKKEFKNKILILFVGRLEDNKNCKTFIDAILKINDDLKKKFKVLIVGDGKEKKSLLKIVNNSSHKSIFKFYGLLSNQQVHSFYNECDIYVSLNKLGNLSNTCLEAYSRGICCIIPESQKEKGIDLITDKLIPKYSVRRIKWDDIEGNLTNELTYLLENPVEIQNKSKLIKKVSIKLIPSWKQRIDKEIGIINNIIKNNGKSKT